MKKNILEYLETAAASFPGNKAVEDESLYFRYDELLEFSERVGSAIASFTSRNKPIPVLAEKNAFTVGVFMGIVQAGCYYCLLNPDLPIPRLIQIQSVLEADYLITDHEHLEIALSFFQEDRILLIENLMTHQPDRERLNQIRRFSIDMDPLYVNFTSGSSGIPKGVLVSHRSVIDFIEVFTEEFGIDQNDKIANQAPLDFDVSVKDLYSAFKTGATLVLIPKALFSKPAALVDYLCEREITTMIWAVSALCLITTFHGLEYRVPSAVKRILFSGEVMPEKALRNWIKYLPDADYINLYGPTEITCNCTWHRIDKNRTYPDGYPIGKAFSNEEVFLLNEEDQLVTKPGMTGEICVRGTALALGYLNNKEQTDRVFVQNPLNRSYYDRIYRTGDLACYNQEGELQFCGRKDFQIKFRGHRIEMEEVERAISEREGVDRCCVIFDEKRQRLLGFYTGNIEKKVLHKELQEVLPVYMIPSALRQIDAFPLTKNGKTDRRKLMEMRKGR